MKLILLLCFVLVAPTVCDARFSVRNKATADQLEVSMTLYDSYPKCKMTLLKLNEAESNTIEQEQTPIRKPGYPRRVKQCVFKFRSLTPSSIYVARLYLFVKSRVFQSKLVWSVPKVVVYRTKPRLAKPVRPVRPVKKPVEQNETAIIKKLHRNDSLVMGASYEILAETIGKVVRLTIAPKGRKFEDDQIRSCEVILRYTSNRQGPGGKSKTARYKSNKCVLSFTSLPAGKEISIWVRLRRQFSCNLYYSHWKWLSWGPRYSGFKIKQFPVTQKTKPTVLQRQASPEYRLPYEIRSETTRKLLKLTAKPKSLKFTDSSQEFYCQLNISETQSRGGIQTIRTVNYERNDNRCEFIVNYLPLGKEYSVYVRMLPKCRPGQLRQFSYSDWRWLTWSQKYSGLKTKDADVRDVTSNPQPDFSDGYAVDQSTYEGHVRVIVTLPPNSKDERCDLYARRRIHTKPVERGQCQFEVRAKFPNNVYIRIRVKQSVSVDGKSYQVQTKWRSIKLITMKLLKLKPGSAKLGDLYHVFALVRQLSQETTTIVVRPNRDLSIYKSLSHCEIELHTRGHRTWRFKQPYLNEECRFDVTGLYKRTKFDIRVRMHGGSRDRAPRNWMIWSSLYTGIETINNSWFYFWEAFKRVLRE